MIPGTSIISKCLTMDDLGSDRRDPFLIRRSMFKKPKNLVNRTKINKKWPAGD